MQAKEAAVEEEVPKKEAEAVNQSSKIQFKKSAAVYI